MNPRRLIATAFTLLVTALPAIGDELRMNQIQVIGTHNSYHIVPSPGVMKVIAVAGRGRVEGLDYSHKPLADQFTRLGVRQIELDVFADPKGGHYASLFVRKLLLDQGLDPGPNPNEGGMLDRPGLKVFHVQDIDYLSTETSFVDALKTVRSWSKAHPRHVPIMILVELKDESIIGLPTRPVAFGKAELDGVDAEIASVFDREEIVSPDLIRGESPTLRDAIRTRGWPSLESSRGKVIFALDNEGALRDRYLDGHEALRGRPMFASVGPEHPAAAWMKINDPVGDFDRIQQMVRDGLLVRTRADADTKEARINDTSRRDKALASGAQFVSTDYPEPRPEFSGYRARLPGGVVARTNPLIGPRTDADQEAISTRR